MFLQEKLFRFGEILKVELSESKDMGYTRLTSLLGVGLPSSLLYTLNGLISYLIPNAYLAASDFIIIYYDGDS